MKLTKEELTEIINAMATEIVGRELDYHVGNVVIGDKHLTKKGNIKISKKDLVCVITESVTKLIAKNEIFFLEV